MTAPDWRSVQSSFWHPWTETCISYIRTADEKPETVVKENIKRTFLHKTTEIDLKTNRYFLSLSWNMLNKTVQHPSWPFNFIGDNYLSIIWKRKSWYIEWINKTNWCFCIAYKVNIIIFSDIFNFRLSGSLKRNDLQSLASKLGGLVTFVSNFFQFFSRFCITLLCCESRKLSYSQN